MVWLGLGVWLWDFGVGREVVAGSGGGLEGGGGLGNDIDGVGKVPMWFLPMLSLMLWRIVALACWRGRR